VPIRRLGNEVRIAQVAPLAESVPPKLYGGTERVVSWLTEELVALGHDVTLFASGDSRTRAKLVPACPRALRLSRPRPDPALGCAMLLEAVAERAGDFDVIHCHIDWVHLPLLRRLRTPFLTTLHGRLDLPDLPSTAKRFPDARFVSISVSQRAPVPGLNWLATIHHGLPPDLLKLSERPEGYLAFLGRISPEKGPDIAIRVAHAAGLRLRVAAKIPRAQNRYFNETIKPLLDQNNVEFVREVNERQKQDFLGNATALLFPINWPEPFGLVMIEAMACGTPVIAWPRGSVPEIVEDGITGFLVESEAEAVAAIGRIGDLDRRHIRERFDERFTARRMAEEYINSYRMLMFQSQIDVEPRQIKRADTPQMSADSHLDAFGGK
jgi:glycosyltransferase involved in cell wall biosynthesis